MTESKAATKAQAVVAGADTQQHIAPEPELERQAVSFRRMVLVSGNGSDPVFERGDIAVLDRKSIGRKTLTALVERLAEANATGLVLNDDVLSDLPIREREALAEKLPLLVLGPEHASTRLLDEAPPQERPAAVLRAILRGD